MSDGPLQGLRVVELAGIGPGPFAAMLLADLGADVVGVHRPGTPDAPAAHDLLARGRRRLVVDLRTPAGRESVLTLVEVADVVIEGNRPGVAERLGVGPDDCLARNPGLVYGRMTGWGQHGPRAHAAGHDITYLALSGALHAIGAENGPPVPPVNLLGDFGGGSLYLITGILAALVEVQRSGHGQVVDAAIVDGAASLTTLLHGMNAAGEWSTRRGTNMLDGGRPWYDVYETLDGEWMAVGALEPQFFAEFCRLLPLHVDDADRSDATTWPAMRQAIAATFRTRTRDEWEAVFGDTDACVAPVLSLTEAAEHPHNRARRTFVDVDGIRCPATAPRFSRTPGSSAEGSRPATVGEIVTTWS
ncbi:CaiB/BaiF CoA transferase family protein [Williamsia sp. SKLECPSW1]